MPTDRLTNPLSAEFPMSGPPFLSRVTEHEISGELSEGGSKNYKHVMFRPGYALQAAELNEIQEQFQMQLTLTMNMYHNWLYSGRPELWGDAPEGTLALGDGGSGLTTIGTPGWKGTCPLFPYDSPYITGGSTSLVDVEVGTAAGISIQFRPGWFLTEVQGVEAVGEDSPFFNGLKYWVYNNIAVNFGSISVGVPDELTFVGFRTAYSTVTPEEDSDLYDQAGGYSSGNPASGGAARYQVRLESIGSITAGDSQEDTISKVLKIDPSDRTIRYMNNLLLATY